jgi:hypothetical protein
MKRVMIIALAIAALCAGRAVGLDAQTNAQTKTKTMNISGTVKAVSGNSLIVTAAGKDMTFTIDKETRFVGKGLGTKAKAGPVTVTDAVGAGDKVRVTYHDMGATLHAASVSITAKAVPSK